MTKTNGNQAETQPGTSVETSTAPVIRTSAGLRNALFDELDSLRNGTTNAQKANAVAKIADQVIQTVKMELEVQKHLAKAPKQKEGAQPPALGAPIALG